MSSQRIVLVLFVALARLLLRAAALAVARYAVTAVVTVAVGGVFVLAALLRPLARVSPARASS